MPATLHPLLFNPAGLASAQFVAGAALQAGTAVAPDALDGRLYACDSRNANRTKLVGLMAHSTEAAGQPARVVGMGTVSVGPATFDDFVGSPRFIGGGANAGKLIGASEFADGDMVILAGFVGSDSQLLIFPLATGIAWGAL